MFLRVRTEIHGETFADSRENSHPQQFPALQYNAHASAWFEEYTVTFEGSFEGKEEISRSVFEVVSEVLEAALGQLGMERREEDGGDVTTTTLKILHTLAKATSCVIKV